MLLQEDHTSMVELIENDQRFRNVVASLGEVGRNHISFILQNILAWRREESMPDNATTTTKTFRLTM
jgi:hypothetical protein